MKKKMKILGYFIAVVVLFIAVLPFLTYGVNETSSAVVVQGQKYPEPQFLEVMTLNVAHGRRDSFFQMFLSKQTITTNLNDISAMLVRENPYIIALQEADGPSVWSSNFNHVQHLAENSQMYNYFRGEHVQGLKLSYGTALLSKLPMKNSQSVTFPMSWPSFSKGFVVSTITWNNRDIDIVSVHLDFLLAQKKQLKVMQKILQERKRPMVVMGDFNCDWENLQNFAKELSLQAYQPNNKTPTFPTTKARIDWILVSSDWEFLEYRVVPDVLSDHLAVIAKLRFVK